MCNLVYVVLRVTCQEILLNLNFRESRVTFDWHSIPRIYIIESHGIIWIFDIQDGSRASGLLKLELFARYLNSKVAWFLFSCTKARKTQDPNKNPEMDRRDIRYEIRTCVKLRTFHFIYLQYKCLQKL